MQNAIYVIWVFTVKHFGSERKVRWKQLTLFTIYKHFLDVNLRHYSQKSFRLINVVGLIS